MVMTVAIKRILGFGNSLQTQNGGQGAGERGLDKIGMTMSAGLDEESVEDEMTGQWRTVPTTCIGLFDHSLIP